MTRFFVSALCLACILFLSAPCRAAEEKVEGPEPPPQLDVDDIPLQLATARVGDWAKYAANDGQTLRLTVVERWTEHGDDHLVVESAKHRGKKNRVRTEEEQISVKDHAADMRDLGPDDYLTESTVLVNGRKVHCIIINYHEDGELTRQSYFSDQVPVYGLVRGVTVEGKKRTTTLRLEDFEFADEE